MYSAGTGRTIYISYGEEDKDFAIVVGENLKSLIGSDVWIKDLSLSAGDFLVDSVLEAIDSVKWFILIVSKSFTKNKWLSLELNSAMIKSLERNDYNIIVVYLDDVSLPKHLTSALAGLKKFASEGSNDDLILEIAKYINEYNISAGSNVIFVDRGGDSDRFSILARKNPIIFIHGWAGIGKTAFVVNSLSGKLKKIPITVQITRGHSTDLLARGILQKLHIIQPTGIISSDILEEMALKGVKERASKIFLLLDNAEDALDSSNRPLKYLDDFLYKFMKLGIETHLILTTTRYPEIPLTLASIADILKLEGLDDLYVKESIDLWLEGSDRQKAVMTDPQLKNVIDLVGGHPLAAKMVASFLKTKAIPLLLSATERQKFELKFAEFVLRSTDLTLLDEVDRIILHILSTVKVPLLVEDLLAVKELSKLDLEGVHNSLCRLSDLNLVDLDGEMYSIHSFLAAYFRDQLSKYPQRIDKIAMDYGMYAYNKVKQTNDSVKHEQVISPDTERLVKLTNEMFRYIVPASKLLRMVGKNSLADDLPMEIKGTIRELVFYFYQEKRDYRTAKSYAEKWLQVDPTDTEIQLYLSRCLRNQRGSNDLLDAEHLLDAIGGKNPNQRLQARILRERALIEEARGDLPKAKAFYKKGIGISKINPYPENYVGLARILLRESDALGEGSPQKITLAQEAVRHLDTAKTQLANFDRFHLGLYVEALIEAGREDIAWPLIIKGLEDNPEDERLNHRMAEILRKKEVYDQAEPHARKALRLGARKAHLSLANILLGQYLNLWIIDKVSADKKIEEALAILKQFVPEYGNDREVCDCITARIYRIIGSIDKAKEHIIGYVDSNSPYTVYEQCKIDIHEAIVDENSGFIALANECWKRANNRIIVFKSKNRMQPQLAELEIEIQEHLK